MIDMEILLVQANMLYLDQILHENENLLDISELLRLTPLTVRCCPLKDFRE